MTTADKAVRVAAVAAVLSVAGVAAWVSYRHCVAVVSAYGEGGWVGRFYPATIDGLIVAASMVLLDSARSKAEAPALAKWMLAAGIGATLTVNIMAGVAHGAAGAVASAWPAAAFIGAYEALMLLIRAGARRSAESPARSAAKAVPEARPPHTRTRKPTPRRTPSAPVTETDAASEFMDELARGELPSIRQIRTRLHLGQERAQQVQAHLRTLARTP